MEIDLPYPEFLLIQDYYGDKCAERSGVPLMNHILEGLALLQFRGATIVTQKAWVLHPLLQSDEALGLNFGKISGLDPFVVAMVMEYRHRANSWLSDKVGKPVEGSEVQGCVMIGYPSAGDLIGVRAMLIADKVQNRKDFEKYHKGTHPRSAELEAYFNAWLKALDISEEEYQGYVRFLEGLGT